MTREELLQRLSNSKDAPYRVDVLKSLLKQIDHCKGNEIEREMFYTLVSIVIELGDRVKQLEYHKLLKENVWSASDRQKKEGRDKLSVWRDSLLPSDGETSKPRVKWGPDMGSKDRKQPRLEDEG